MIYFLFLAVLTWPSATMVGHVWSWSRWQPPACPGTVSKKKVLFLSEFNESDNYVKILFKNLNVSILTYFTLQFMTYDRNKKTLCNELWSNMLNNSVWSIEIWPANDFIGFIEVFNISAAIISSFFVHVFIYSIYSHITWQMTSTIEEGYRQKKRQRSSLLFGGEEFIQFLATQAILPVLIPITVLVIQQVMWKWSSTR